MHSLALLERKTNALDQAAPLAGWVLPEGFAQLRRLMEARLGKKGKREFVQVLRLLEMFALAEVAQAIDDALLMGTISFDVVKHLLLCRIERRQARLDLENSPHLPTFPREFDKVAQQCAAEGVGLPRCLLRLSELELLDRERRATERRLRQAKFDVVKSVDTFDFLAIPSLETSLVLDLGRCEFIQRKENILALGNSGTGKTHIALALGLAGCQIGFRVRFTAAASLAHEPSEAKDERRLMRFQEMFSSFELQIIDELDSAALRSPWFRSPMRLWLWTAVRRGG